MARRASWQLALRGSRHAACYMYPIAPHWAASEETSLDKPRIWPGRSYPLGATWDGAGANFALFSEHATKVELCLFDSPNATQESQQIVMPEHTDQVWHCYLPDV